MNSDYKMGAIFDSNDDITGYQCVECTSIIDPNTGVAWVSGSTIDCSITAIESEFCGTNMYPSKLIRFDLRIVGTSAYSWKVLIFIQLRLVLRTETFKLRILQMKQFQLLDFSNYPCQLQHFIFDNFQLSFWIKLYGFF